MANRNMTGSQLRDLYEGGGYGSSMSFTAFARQATGNDGNARSAGWTHDDYLYSGRGGSGGRGWSHDNDDAWSR